MGPREFFSPKKRGSKISWLWPFNHYSVDREGSILYTLVFITMKNKEEEKLNMYRYRYFFNMFLIPVREWKRKLYGQTGNPVKSIFWEDDWKLSSMRQIRYINIKFIPTLLISKRNGSTSIFTDTKTSLSQAHFAH